MSNATKHIILCGGATLPRNLRRHPTHLIHRYSYDKSSKEQNVNLELPHFIKQVNCHFKQRVKDLLEIAGYVYAADRMTKRGQSNQLEYHSWSRHFHFFIKVRDYSYWNKKSVKEKLSEMLTFISGDFIYDFTFLEGGNDVGQGNLFDNENLAIDKQKNSCIALFSGGLDSLAGALTILNQTDKKIILVTHQSNNFVVTKIQQSIFNLLNTDYSGRLQRYSFTCSLHGERAVEETQRTRFFLYTSIAYALTQLTDEKTIYAFENGMTSINFAKRQDMINARASRTTHPKTINLLQELFSSVAGEPVTIQHPFFHFTKTDVFGVIKGYSKLNYLNSTITCTRTFNVSNKTSPSTHCGECSQCIDRRFASFAAGVEEYDAVYDTDVARGDSMKDEEGYTHLCDYINLAFTFGNQSGNQFSHDMLPVLIDLVPYLPGSQSNSEKVEQLYQLTQRHATQVLDSLQKIRATENLFAPKKPKTIFSFIDDRVFLRPSAERLIQRICEKMSVALPMAFQRTKPDHENVLNDQIQALLASEASKYEREFPGIKFSSARTIPDHSYPDYDLLIEAKLLKSRTSPSIITDQIGADMHKYGDARKLFILYDPIRKIVNEVEFKQDFEKYSGCFIHIVR